MAEDAAKEVDVEGRVGGCASGWEKNPMHGVGMSTRLEDQSSKLQQRGGWI